ncbi:MAG: hypothetical protein H6652_18760 [Ardenticatenaceae bacterium]|nr:hypothetical protein [Ardenticatenaceae bacterium]
MMLDKTWQDILRQPSARKFETRRQNYAGNSGWTGLFLSLGIMALLRGTAVFIAELLGNRAIGSRTAVSLALAEQLELNVDLVQVVAFSSSPILGAAIMFVGLLVFTPLIILLGYRTAYGLAKLMGGAGDFKQQAFLLNSIFAPTLILAGLLGFLGRLGDVLMVVLIFYTAVPTFYALQVIHKIARWKIIVSTFFYLRSCHYLYCLDELHHLNCSKRGDNS